MQVNYNGKNKTIYTPLIQQEGTEITMKQQKSYTNTTDTKDKDSMVRTTHKNTSFLYFVLQTIILIFYFHTICS